GGRLIRWTQEEFDLYSNDSSRTGLPCGRVDLVVVEVCVVPVNIALFNVRQESLGPTEVLKGRLRGRRARRASVLVAPRGESVSGIVEVVCSQRQLLEVVGAAQSGSRFAHFLHGRQQEPDEDGD